VKFKDCATQALLKTGDVFRCPGRATSCCSTNDTRRFNHWKYQNICVAYTL